MPDVRPNTIRLLSVHLANAFQFHRRLLKKKIVPHKYLRIFNLPYSTCYVTVIYLLVKLGYLCNAIGNFLLMNHFLNGNSKKQDLYGWRALSEILNGTQWHHTGFFPRVTICDFKVRLILLCKEILADKTVVCFRRELWATFSSTVFSVF